MATSPPDLDTRSLDELKRLVTELLARVAALEEENRRLRGENARLKDLPKRPKLAPGGMDRATEPAGGPSRGGKRQWRARTITKDPGGDGTLPNTTRKLPSSGQPSRSCRQEGR